MFEFVHDLLQAESISEMAELSATHSRRQFEMMAEQTRELAAAAQKLATQASLPLTSRLGKDFGQMSEKHSGSDNVYCRRLRGLGTFLRLLQSRRREVESWQAASQPTHHAGDDAGHALGRILTRR